MCDYAYYNGVYTPYDSTVIPLSDRSIFFGDAVYDVMIGRNKKVYQINEHISRLKENGKRISLNMMESVEDIISIVNVLLEKSGHNDFILYIQLSGCSKRRAHLNDTTEYNLLVTMTKATHPWTPAEIHAITLPDLRYSYCDIKTVNLIPAVLSLREAQRQNADIAIFHRNGFLTECSHANIAIVRDNEIFTPPLDNSILPGITRRNLISVCSNIGIKITERPLGKNELYSADAVMATSTTQFIKICTSIDGIQIKNYRNPIVKELFDLLYYDFLCNTTV